MFQMELTCNKGGSEAGWFSIFCII